jgi:nicotinate-nucleotide adenylyltransferase
MDDNKGHRIGIMGGTYNPIHLGHIHAALKSKKHLKLDKLFIIPAATPPHKEFLRDIPDKDRLESVRLAFKRRKNVEVSDLELMREGKSYSIDTVLHFRKAFPHSEIFLIIGTDMFLTFEQWHRFTELFENVTLTVIPRSKNELGKLKAHAKHLHQLYSAKIRILNLKPFDISSTYLRQSLKDREDVSEYLEPAVYSYILERGLYL